jgi:hypothetical protein
MTKNYPAGFEKIKEGSCERGCKTESACGTCYCGHLCECHYPNTCDVADCDHYNEVLIQRGGCPHCE